MRGDDRISRTGSTERPAHHGGVGGQYTAAGVDRSFAHTREAVALEDFELATVQVLTRHIHLVGSFERFSHHTRNDVCPTTGMLNPTVADDGKASSRRKESRKISQEELHHDLVVLTAIDNHLRAKSAAFGEPEPFVKGLRRHVRRPYLDDQLSVAHRSSESQRRVEQGLTHPTSSPLGQEKRAKLPDVGHGGKNG